MVSAGSSAAILAGLFAVACEDDSGDACPGWDATTVGTVEDGPLDEPSGLVVSTVEPDVLWSHNDAGDEPRLFALAPSGTILREYLVSDVAMGDWEDLAIVNGTLWIGDLGADADSPPLLVGVPLPLVGAGDDEEGVLVPSLVVAVTFPDERPDVEAIFWDEPSARMVLVSRATGVATHVFTVDLENGEAKALTTLAFGEGVLEGDDEVTGGASTAGGFALRTRSSAFLWARGSEDLEDALASDPCPIAVDETPGGETIAFSDDETVYLLGDGSNAPIVESAE